MTCPMFFRIFLVTFGTKFSFKKPLIILGVSRERIYRE